MLREAEIAEPWRLWASKLDNFVLLFQAREKQKVVVPEEQLPRMTCPLTFAFTHVDAGTHTPGSSSKAHGSFESGRKHTATENISKSSSGAI